MSGKENIWYAFRGQAYAGNQPAFYDANRFPFLAPAESHFKEIFREIEALALSKNTPLQPYFNNSLVQEGKWEVITFQFWNERDEKNCAACPELDAFLWSVPGLITAGVSRLAPHTAIKPHIGDTNAIVRCHLGLSVPTGLPECGIEVNGQQREWHEGKWIAFCDAHQHSAWNRTDKFRYVLLLDFILPEFADEKTNVVKDVRSYLQLQDLLQRKPWMKRLPGKVKGMIRRYYKNKIA